jgi:hypothetical protein
METIKIRELRGSTLEEYARKGELVGLTRDRALIAVVIPIVQAWVEQLIDQNWSRVMHSVATGETELASPAKMTTLDDVLGEADLRDAAAAETSPEAPADRVRHTAHAVTSAPHRAAEKVTAAWGSIGTPGEMISRILPAFSAGSPDEPAITSSTNVRIRDLSAHRIEQAGENKELLILTNGGMLLGLVVPVSQQLVQFLITENITRIMLNAQMAEGEVSAGEPFTTVDEVAQEADEPSREQVPQDPAGQSRTEHRTASQ